MCGPKDRPDPSELIDAVYPEEEDYVGTDLPDDLTDLPEGSKDLGDFE